MLQAFPPSSSRRSRAIPQISPPISRASVLIDETSALADPLQGARVTLYGRAEQTTANDDVRRRFLARHPDAAFYADFPDFSFWRLDVEGAHYIGGFGRIFDLTPSELVLPLDGAESLIAAEAEIVEHMNADHADALELYATALAGASPGGWRMTGIDPEGLDIVLGSEPRRVLFAERANTPETARKELVKLAAEARARARDSIPPRPRPRLERPARSVLGESGVAAPLHHSPRDPPA